MALTDIIAGGILGIVAGGLTGFIIPLILNKLRSKNSIKKIKKQKMSYMLNGKKYDFVGDIDKSLKSNSKSEGVDLPKKGEGNNKDGLTEPSPSENQSQEDSEIAPPNLSGGQNQTKLTELNQKL